MTLCWCVNSRGARGAYLVAPGAREMSERADLASGVRGMSLDDADPSSDAASPCPPAPEHPPIFGLETLERNANRGGGVITTGAAADGLVVVGTTRGACVVHDLTAGAYREIDCLPLDDADRSRRELTVARIWLDPTARHAVAVLRDDDGRIVDTVYFHATFRRARPILGVRDASVVVTAVGWLADACEDDAARDVLVGADDGSLFALHLDADPSATRPDRAFRRLLDGAAWHTPESIPSSRRIVGCHVVRVDETFTVLVATPSRLHAFVGAGSLEETLRGSGGRGPGGGGPEALVTMPEDAPRSELHVWRDAKGRRAPDRFAWLVAGGVYRGHLAPEDAEPGAADRVLDNHSLVPFPPPPRDGTLDGTSEDALSRHPLSVAATNHHVLSLFPSTAEAVNVVTGDPVDPVSLARLMPLGATPDADAPHARCLATDPITRDVYLITATAILRVTAKDEDRDAWRWHLDRGEFTLALEKCSDDARRGAVHARCAEMASRAGEHMRAAACYAEAGAAVSFEAVCLGFLDRGEDDALALYLRRRLDVVDRERDPETAKKLANWLADLHVSRACQAEEGTLAEAEAEADLRAFVAEHARWLDPEATRKLLVEYGREDDVAFFAEVFGDWAESVAHSLRRGDAGRAIETLSNPEVPAEEVYAAAAELFRLAPARAVDMFLDAGPSRLDPSRLAHAFEPCLEETRGDDRDDEHDDAAADDRDDRENAAAASTVSKKREAIRFLQTAVTRQGALARDVHDLLVRFLADAHRHSPAALTRYLVGAGRSGGGEPMYDRERAARLCETAGATDAAIQIRIDAGQLDRALRLALDAGDVDAAVRVADARDGGLDADPNDSDGGLAHADDDTDRSDDSYSEDDDDDEPSRRAPTRRLKNSRRRLAARRRAWREIARSVVTRGFGVATREEDVEAHAADLDDFTREKERALDAFEREIGRNIASADAGADRWEATAAATAAAANASPIADDPERRSAIVREALALAPRSRGALTVEDVLRLLPDFTEMDEVRDAVLAELERFRARAESSRRETNANLALAAEIEAEMAEMESREVEIRWDHPCASCGGIISAPPAAFAHYAALGQDPEAMAERSPVAPFFLFPCGMAFHASCLVDAGVPWMLPKTRRRCLDLIAKLRVPLTRETKAMCRRWARKMEAKKGGEGGGERIVGAGRDDPPEDPPGTTRPGDRGGGRVNGDARSARGGSDDPKIEVAENDAGNDAEAVARVGGTDAGANRGADAGWDPGAAAAELEDLLCAECPYCGEMMLRQIDAPFITEDDAEEAELWKM